jgi:hypothetical protein
MKPIWGPGPRPSITQLYTLVAKESIHRGKAGNKALPGYESAYYVEDAIHRWFGVEHAFGKYSITGVHESMEARAYDNLVQAPEVFNQDPSKVNILSPVNSSESTRRVPSSSQQGRRRGGTPTGSEVKLGIELGHVAKVVWKSGKKGGKKRPTCPKGFRLRRVGKRLMCVKS